MVDNYENTLIGTTNPWLTEKTLNGEKNLKGANDLGVSTTPTNRIRESPEISTQDHAVIQLLNTSRRKETKLTRLTRRAFKKFLLPAEMQGARDRMKDVKYANEPSKLPDSFAADYPFAFILTQEESKKRIKRIEDDSYLRKVYSSKVEFHLDCVAMMHECPEEAHKVDRTGKNAAFYLTHFFERYDYYCNCLKYRSSRQVVLFVLNYPLVPATKASER